MPDPGGALTNGKAHPIDAAERIHAYEPQFFKRFIGRPPSVSGYEEAQAAVAAGGPVCAGAKYRELLNDCCIIVDVTWASNIPGKNIALLFTVISITQNSINTL